MLLALFGLAATVLVAVVAAVLSWGFIGNMFDGDIEDSFEGVVGLIVIAFFLFLSALAIWQPLHWAGLA